MKKSRKKSFSRRRHHSIRHMTRSGSVLYEHVHATNNSVRSEVTAMGHQYTSSESLFSTRTRTKLVLISDNRDFLAGDVI